MCLFWFFNSHLSTKLNSFPGLLSFLIQIIYNLFFSKICRRIEKAAKFLVGKNLAHSLFFARAPKINGKIDEQMVKDDNGRLPPELRLPTMYLFPRERTYGKLSHWYVWPLTHFVEMFRIGRSRLSHLCTCCLWVGWTNSCLRFF